MTNSHGVPLESQRWERGRAVTPSSLPSEVGSISRGIWGWGGALAARYSSMLTHLPAPSVRCSAGSSPRPRWAPLLLWTAFSTLPGWHPPHSS